MTWYRVCPDCGATLDPDERCDCQDNGLEELRVYLNSLKGGMYGAKESEKRASRNPSMV